MIPFEMVQAYREIMTLYVDIQNGNSHISQHISLLKSLKLGQEIIMPCRYLYFADAETLTASWPLGQYSVVVVVVVFSG